MFFDQMVMEIKLIRRHLFYAVIFMLPNVLLYALSALVFLVPVESGEKISFSITILLAFVVSFGTISELLPASSLNFPIIAYFLGAAVTQMTLDTILATVGKIALIELCFSNNCFFWITSRKFRS